MIPVDWSPRRRSVHGQQADNTRLLGTHPFRTQPEATAAKMYRGKNGQLAWHACSVVTDASWRHKMPSATPSLSRIQALDTEFTGQQYCLQAFGRAAGAQPPVHLNCFQLGMGTSDQLRSTR
jgi:hypothetical protein